ncbi:MAG TPA: MarR family transcriptional regulator [Clostridia bacterium]|nr:MarR family transcriptional regulator [Clostridia bacterium]
MELQLEHALAARLRACGHFLYYQTGGKAGQRRILVTLLKRGSLTQKELQDTLEVSAAALSEILGKMEEASLIERKKSDDDKRQVRLLLLQKGRSAAIKAQEHYVRMLDRMFECLSDAEKNTLDEILGKLAAHLDTLRADPILEAGAEGAHCKQCKN